MTELATSKLNVLQMKNILPSLLLLFLLILLDVDDVHGRRLRGLHDLLSLEAKKTLFNTFAEARGSSVYLQRFTWPALRR